MNVEQNSRRLPLSELERLCQKPDHRRIGNFMARRMARPLALRVTWVVQPWPVSAHAATLAAMACAVGAAVALGLGTVGSWIAGAALLQLWYLLDHVDGQLARLRGTDSLDGTQLDYLMHHAVNVLVPLSIGFGLARNAWVTALGTAHDVAAVRGTLPAAFLWDILGIAAALGLLLAGLGHDARHKAFFRRLKRVRGELVLSGGGGARPVPTANPPRRPLRFVAWIARKACEIHVVINTIAAIALVQWLLGDEVLVIARNYLGVLAPLSLLLAGATIWRDIAAHAAEAEFKAWFRPPPGSELHFRAGWWDVEPVEAAQIGDKEQRGSPARGGEGAKDASQAADACIDATSPSRLS
ncbi:MAG: CDP-alcohol phosphatidyltransferase family protein [Planctomycetia bacterium]|nr:CDP-alcohol phosphatidyltransferase family protein [Planctomycetia bacterium]